MASSRLKEGNTLVSACIVALDAVAVWSSGMLMHRLSFDTWQVSGAYASLMMAASLLMVMASSTVYKSFRGGALFAMLGRVTLAWTMVWVSLVVWLMAISATSNYSRLFLGSWGLATLATLFFGRGFSVVVLRWFRSNGYSERQVLLVGAGPVTDELRRRIERATWTGYKIKLTIDPAQLSVIRKLGESSRFHEIWINLGIDQMHRMPTVLQSLNQSTADIRMVPDVFLYRMTNHGTSSIAGVQMVDISSSPITGLNALFKKIEDYVLASLILLLISPLMLVIAIAVKMSSPGPVIYRQLRHGWNGEPILIYKFRSMKLHAEAAGTVTQAKREDARLTSIGAFLRRTSLDELPQFINVLQGRMSIVGPRPHALEHNLHYKGLIPLYMLRHKVKPGITGWAQINGFRGETETVDKMQARVDHDLLYLERWSVWFDLRIVALTIAKGFSDRKAY